MVTVKERLECEGRKVKLKLTDGRIIRDYCLCFTEKEDDEEEDMLEFRRREESFKGHMDVIFQSEIESIKILD